MRHVVLVIVLVGAAFLGGAFVNGPGLRWVQTQVLGSLGLDDGGEIATVDLKAAPVPERPGERSPRTPATLAPPLVTEALEKAATPELQASGRVGPDGAAAPRSPAMPTRSPAPAPSRLDPPPLTAPVAEAGRMTRDPDVTRAAAAPAPKAPARAPADRDREARPALMDSLASLIPTPAPAPPEGLAPPAPSPAPAPSPSSPSLPSSPSPARPGDEDWAALARKMQALGISRFTIEGQPGGRVVFSCLIPLAGRQAVTQRFEADGEDAVQAARAALRRVALWRATQPQPTSP